MKITKTNVFYAYHAWDNADPTKISEYGAKAKTMKQALENWEHTDLANTHTLFMISVVKECYVRND